ncbi:34364_t:CDS:1, partial [Racocetra persica]
IKQRTILASLSNTLYNQTQNNNEQFSTLIYSFWLNDYANTQSKMLNSDEHEFTLLGMANLKNCLNTWFKIIDRTEDNLNKLLIWIELYKSVKLNRQRIYATKNFYQRSHYANVAIEMNNVESINRNNKKKLYFGKVSTS